LVLVLSVHMKKKTTRELVNTKINNQKQCDDVCRVRRADWW
jgi:hypothetical protein